MEAPRHPRRNRDSRCDAIFTTPRELCQRSIEELEPRYAATKLAGDAYCLAWWEKLGVPTSRYLNLFGSRSLVCYHRVTVGSHPLVYVTASRRWAA
jgi:hypothetical protein